MARRAPPPAGPLSPDPPPSFDSVGGLAHWLDEQTRNDLQAPARALVPAVGEAIDLLAASLQPGVVIERNLQAPGGRLRAT